MEKQKTRGFTIVELLIVVVIIAILAAITIVAFNGIQARATNTARVSSLNVYKKALEMYRAENGQYPAACSNNYNLDCGFTSLNAYLVPKYVNSLPTEVAGKYYASTTSYTLATTKNTKDNAPYCRSGVGTIWYQASLPTCESL